jgi:hypothetical protein
MKSKSKVKAKPRKTNGHLRSGGGKKGGEPDLMTWTPDRQATLTINGVSIDVPAGQKVTLPAAYFHLYQQSRI